MTDFDLFLLGAFNWKGKGTKLERKKRGFDEEKKGVLGEFMVRDIGSCSVFGNVCNVFSLGEHEWRGKEKGRTRHAMETEGEEGKWID